MRTLILNSIEYIRAGGGCEVVFMTTAHRWSITSEEVSAEYREGAPCSSRTGERGDFRCYRRLALLGTVRARNVFVKALGEVRKKSCVRPLYAAAANKAKSSRG
jgi:hypothetical protein